MNFTGFYPYKVLIRKIGIYGNDLLAQLPNQKRSLTAVPRCFFF